MTFVEEDRRYQSEAIAKIGNLIRKGVKRILLCSPTGSGKTVIGSRMIRSISEAGQHSLFMAHRKILINQTYRKLTSFGVGCGVIMSGDRRRDDFHLCQIASDATLARRMDRLPPARYVFGDEIHHAMSDRQRKIYDRYLEQGAILIGMTATPWRGDKVELGDLFQESVLAASVRELMDAGHLIDMPESSYAAYDHPDLHGIKTTGRDYNQRELAKRSNTAVLVGHAVDEYAIHAAGRRAIVFPVDVAHSRSVVAEFEARGYPARHVDCHTPDAERDRIMADYESGAVLILSSVGVLTEGFDAPCAEVAILLRATKSLALHIQMIGRVLRPSPGKTSALVHDHAGNLLRHGLADDPRCYGLNETNPDVIARLTCPACYRVFTAIRKGCCPHCGELIHIPEDRAQGDGEGRGGAEREVIDGIRITGEKIRELRERGMRPDLSDAQIARSTVATTAQKYAELKRLRDVAMRKMLKPGFVSHRFREQFGSWPTVRDRDLYDATPAATEPFFPLPKR